MNIKQYNHQETRNEQNTFPITIICEDIRSPNNIGMIFRIAEAFGIESIYFCNSPYSENTPKIEKIARDTQKYVPHSYEENIEKVISLFKKQKYHLTGLEITNASTSIFEFDFKKHDKLALFIGSERNGISENTLKKLDSIIQIPMFGKNSSINVVNALSIGIYEIVKQTKSNSTL